MRYQVYFKDHGGNIFSVDQMEAETDVQAIAAARQAYFSGIGDRYEIWRENSLVHTELLGRPSQTRSPADPEWERSDPVVEWLCGSIQRALSTDDEHLFRKLLREMKLSLQQACRHGRSGSPYRLQLRDAHGTVSFDLVLRADDDQEAAKLATVLADHLSADRFDLWCQGDRIASAMAPFSTPQRRDFDKRAQCVVLERELALCDSRRSIAQSRALLKRVESWVSP